MAILVTGGAGFIGSNFILDWAEQSDELIIILDKLTYAGNVSNLNNLNNFKHVFIHGDICDYQLVSQLLLQYQVRAIIHFAAESHVDRSILGPEEFIQTNIIGTFRLLEAAKHYWEKLEPVKKSNFRFIHISTDEVYGSLNLTDSAFNETHRYQPNSPYSASKAASDHLLRAYYHTYGLPGITSNCSNNYGPYQFPEKLIPLCIHNALSNKPIPIYGNGQQIRDWLYVKDHCAAIRTVLNFGKKGDVYNIGSSNEKTNLEVVQLICAILDRERPSPTGNSYSTLMTFVSDRPGHDQRYAINANKITSELGWKPLETFESGLQKTVRWYLDNQNWTQDIVNT
ncbi:MAG: dTDP-glucose 4,6-dehydratase [Legionella sp.]|nr:MAG: dTDP-glucose 4,6-dehydratase [Legionella sp.]